MKKLFLIRNKLPKTMPSKRPLQPPNNRTCQISWLDKKTINPHLTTLSIEKDILIREKKKIKIYDFSGIF